MIIHIQLPDQTQQTLEVSNLRIRMHGNNAPVELTITQEGALLRITAPADDKAWQKLIVHPSAANVIELETRPGGTGASLPAK